MAEYSKEKLYFLKVPKDFFQGHYMRALEGVPNGREYELLYLKLMLESVAYNGWLRLSEGVSYTAEMISGITNTPIDSVRVGLQVLESFGLMSRNDDGSIFLPQVPALTGSTTKGAEKKQEQLARKGGQGVEKIPPRYKRDLENKSIRDLESKNSNLLPSNGNSLDSSIDFAAETSAHAYEEKNDG